jgi:Family of unknown function (DUF6084)
MLDLNFQVEGAEPERSAAIPALLFKVRAMEATKAAAPTPIHSVALRCQIRIEPARRRYDAGEQGRLVDLFGAPDRWGKTVRPLLWTHASAVIRPFAGSTDFDLPIACSYDFSLSATQYFEALGDGEIPLCFLFSGTIFYESDIHGLQVAQIPWEKEAYYRLPAATWRQLIDRHYSNSAWLCLRKDVFDRLREYKSQNGIATWEQTIDALLAEREVAPS